MFHRLLLLVVLSGIAPRATADEHSGPLWMELWRLPLTGIEVRAPEFDPAKLPDFGLDPYVTHVLSGRYVKNFAALSEELSTTSSLGARFIVSLAVPVAGSYTFRVQGRGRIKLEIGERSAVDDSVAHPEQVAEGTLSLPAGDAAMTISFLQDADAPLPRISWSGPGFVDRELSAEDFRRQPAAPGSMPMDAFGTISLDATLLYNYAPSAMLDPEDGSFKIWFCASNDIPGGILGDNIGMKKATTLAGLLDAPLVDVLTPANDPSKFDDVHACDPSVFRWEGSTYLSYSGNTRGTGLSAATRVGMAVSHDRGDSFQRLHSGQFILSPDVEGDGYGVGQSSVVVGNDGFFYMAYTYAPGSVVPENNSIRIVRSPDPTFVPGSIEAVASFPAATIGGFSIDLAFDPAVGQFVIFANATPLPSGPPTSRATLVTATYFDATWQIARQRHLRFDSNWTFGEGIGVLKDPAGHLKTLDADGKRHLVLVGSTTELSSYTYLWAPWVEGDLKYLVAEFEEYPRFFRP